MKTFYFLLKKLKLNDGFRIMNMLLMSLTR